MIARYILCVLWGALTASGWWATYMWPWGVPTGPNNVALVGIFTIISSAFMLGTIIYLLFKHAGFNKEVVIKEE